MEPRSYRKKRKRTGRSVRIYPENTYKTECFWGNTTILYVLWIFVYVESANLRAQNGTCLSQIRQPYSVARMSGLPAHSSNRTIILHTTNSNLIEKAMSTPVKSVSIKDTNQITPDREKLYVLMKRESLPSGILFVCILDQRSGMYPVPSHTNYFGTVKVSNPIIDTGCKTLLISIDSPSMLNQIFNDHPPSDFMFSVGGGVGTGGPMNTMVVRSISPQYKFNITFGVDRFEEGTAVAQVPFLRFHLSKEDANGIINDEVKLERFPPADRDRLEQVIENFVMPMPVTLVGNTILDQFTALSFGGVKLFVDFKLVESSTFATLPQLVNEITSSLRLDGESREALDAYADYTDLCGYSDPEFDF
jgi:hypothetical protein